ncbi:homeobox protein zampogna-like [Actinia tenebrosa]|uniref:Homeobox protein zampogna-like n=1 Tax=Actinia tenebrosa TaxID=6105 RepID=A0A6P8I8Q2_ACTTE|nr:homeobox protein zampogna-like [Actinia tenebrosa]
MYQAIEVDVSSKTKPLNKKASFMVEDLLRSTHTSSTDTNDCSPSQQLNTERHCKTSSGRSWTKEDSRSTETSPNYCTSTRDESTHCHQDDSSPVSSTSNTAAALSNDQQHHLEKVFRLQRYLGTKERQRLAATIRATDQQVKMWFQNKRVTLKLQIDKAQHRQAKLAYLNSLAQSLLNTTQQPSLPQTVVKPSVRKCFSLSSRHIPYRNYDDQLSSRYSRPQRVTPYSWNQNRYRLDWVPNVVHYHPQVVPYLS